MPKRNTAQVTSTRHTVAASSRCIWLAGVVLAAPALAADPSTFGDDALATLQQEAQPLTPLAAYEVNSRVLPHLGDTHFGAPVLRLGGGFANATQHIDITRWFSPPDGPRSLGLSLGMSSTAPLAGMQLNTPTSLDLGVRWRARLDSGRHLDVSAWAQAPQRTASPDAMGLIWQQEPLYTTRVEVQWTSSRSHGLMPEFGAIGLQLQGNSRLVLRARKGGPMLYYRAKF